MKVLSTNVQSPKQLNAPSNVVTQVGSSQMNNDSLKDYQSTLKQECPESCCVLSESTISVLDRLVKYIKKLGQTVSRIRFKHRAS